MLTFKKSLSLSIKTKRNDFSPVTCFCEPNSTTIEVYEMCKKIKCKIIEKKTKIYPCNSLFHNVCVSSYLFGLKSPLEEAQEGSQAEAVHVVNL